MKRLAKFSAFLAAASFSIATGPARGAGHAGKIKVLIVDGQSNHNWQATTGALAQTLLATGRFEVDVSSSPAENAAPAAWKSWRPRFGKYGAVLLNYNGPRWPAELERSFVDYVRSGGGVVVVHSASNAHKGWTEFDQMIGLGGRRDKY